MAIQQLDHIGVVVDDLDAAAAFFAALGMAEEGRATVEGPWVDRINALDGVRADIVMMRTPDGHGRLELTRFHRPAAIAAEPRDALGNVLGLRNVAFVVDDLDAAVTALAAHGGELVGEVAQFGDSYRLCYLRGPAGIIVSLAQRLGRSAPT